MKKRSKKLNIIYGPYMSHDLADDIIDICGRCEKVARANLDELIKDDDTYGINTCAEAINYWKHFGQELKDWKKDN